MEVLALSQILESGFSIQNLGLVDYMMLYFLCLPCDFASCFKKFFMVALKEKRTVYFYLIIWQINNLICHIFIL